VTSSEICATTLSSGKIFIGGGKGLMQIYDFDLVYKTGKYLHVEDALSRAPENDNISKTPLS
jgi:hypothetical protein